MRVVMTDHAKQRAAAGAQLMVCLASASWMASTTTSHATACSFPEQGTGQVADIIDIRTIRLADGAEIRLAGIEPPPGERSPAALAALALGRDVRLMSDNDMPDRYGRQAAFVSLDSSVPDTPAPPLQFELLSQGAALASGTLTNRACTAELAAAEAAARRAGRGMWARDNVIKKAAIPGDILAELGRFVVVEGRVLSVREAGTTTYLNFGRRWTRDFAVTISRRMMTAFAGAGITLKSLERRRIRVRGWVESRGGPRIEVHHLGQIEAVGDDWTADRE